MGFNASLNRCSSERANDKCVLKKRNDVKSALFSMNKELYIMEKDKVKCVDVVVQVSKPKQVVYTSALQAFIPSYSPSKCCDGGM